MALSDTPGETDPQNMSVVQHHIERGDTAKGADGRAIGTVVQMVMDRASGQPSALVIHSDDSNSEFELPWSHIADTSGGQVRLDVAGKDIASVSRPYNPDQYVPVDTGQTVSLAQAGKTAQDEGHPVVMTIQHDAVDLVEPQSPTDEATMPYVSLPPSNLKRTAPLIPEALPQTQPLAGRRQASMAEERELKTEAERETMKPAPNAPPLETSPLPSTEGELVGGKPSTSGSGADSTVPTPGTERSDEGLDSAEPHPADAVMLETSGPPAQVSGGSTSVSQFGGKVQQIGASVQQTARQFAATAQQTGRQVAQTAQQRTQRVAQTAQRRTQQARQTVTDRGTTPLGVGVAAAGLGMGALVGVIAAIRQRQVASTSAKAQGAAASLLQRTQAGAQDVAATAQERAARASLQAKRKAKRAARRARWFRNGLMIGGVLAILFAPERGEVLRAQLAHRVEQWRSKIA